jgi:hypothetical protein
MANERLSIVEQIELECPKCLKRQSVERTSDDPSAATVCRIICLDCDDGDRHAPEYFDGAGAWVHPFAYKGAA